MMSTLTFESIHLSPRRVAARRTAIVPRAVSAPTKPRTGLDTILPRSDVSGWSGKRGLASLACIVVLSHVALIAVLHGQGGENLPPVSKVQTLALEIASPPPPPPEIIQPKPLPQIAKPVAVPVRQPPSAPVVRNDAVDTTESSADTVQVATEQAAAPVAAAPAPPPPVEKVTEARGYAGYLSNPAPVYPPAAQNRRLEGQVVLNVHVLATGKADNVTVAKSSGHTILDEAAIKAVTAWAFDPAKRGDKPIDGWVKVPINFKIS